MNGRFKIYLRRRQNQFEGADVQVQCNPSTGYAEYVPGTIDSSWYDYTDFIEGTGKLSMTWDKVNTGSASTTNQDGSNYDKGISSELIFRDDAYRFIYDWLLTTECQILNAVEVKIVDLIGGGTFRIFEIKTDNIEYAPVDEPCTFSIKLREQDGIWHCVHKNFIWDNWQHWFDDTNAKSHPCFLTCIEPRPRLLSSVRLALLLFFYSNPTISLFAGNIRVDARRILGIDRFVDAPLIRTYIQNIALKCGLLMDTIFDVGQDWENLCLYYPQAGFMHQADSDSVISPSLNFHFDNRWNITLADLLDKLKILFAAEWYVTPNNTIVFKHIKDLIQIAPIYDFTLPGSFTAYGIKYSFNGDKKAAYGRYQYADDGSDLASQEMSTLYNDIVDYDGPANNPMLEGDVTKNFEFAPTGFVRDGRTDDYLNLLIHDAATGASILLGVLTIVTAVLIGSLLLSPVGIALGLLIAAWETRIIQRRNNLNNNFVDDPTYTGAVRLTSEQTLSPRLLLWDGDNMYRAKVVKTDFLPSKNTYYNPDKRYDEKNSIDNDNPSLKVYNYPMYFDADFLDNMFDRYHEPIDNPLKSKESHQNVRFYVDLCPEMLQLFGVYENTYIVIGKVVKLEERDNYDVNVRLENIQVDFDQNRINIKGKVLRR